MLNFDMLRVLDREEYDDTCLVEVEDMTFPRIKEIPMCGHCFSDKPMIRSGPLRLN